jgi:hypothetical protein
LLFHLSGWLDGRLVVRPADESAPPYFKVPAGTDISDSGAALASRGPIRFGGTGIMGQAILLYWGRYQPATVPPGDGLAAHPGAEGE